MKVNITYCKCVVKLIENGISTFKTCFVLDKANKKEATPAIMAHFAADDENKVKVCDCEKHRINFEIPVLPNIDISATFAGSIGITVDADNIVIF